MSGKIIGILSCCVVLALIVTDCATGKSRYIESRVIDKRYKESYTSYYTDSKHHVHSTYHPEEFHVFCQSLDSMSQYDIESRSNYYSKTNGQVVTVKCWKGNWSGITYLSTIE